MSKVSLALLLSSLAWWLAMPGEEEAYVSSPQAAYSWDEVHSHWGFPPDTTESDTSKRDNPNNRIGDATRQTYVTPLFLGMPRNYREEFRLDSGQLGYNIFERIGKVDVRPPSYIGFEDYLEYRRKQEAESYFRDKSLQANRESDNGLELNIDMDGLSDVFGGGASPYGLRGWPPCPFPSIITAPTTPTCPSGSRVSLFSTLTSRSSWG